MIAALEAFVLLIVLLVAVLVYRRLVHSARFARLVADVTHPSPERDEEVLERLNTAEAIAKQRASEADRQVVRNQRTAETLRRRVNRNP